MQAAIYPTPAGDAPSALMPIPPAGPPPATRHDGTSALRGRARLHNLAPSSAASPPAVRLQLRVARDASSQLVVGTSLAIEASHAGVVASHSAKRAGGDSGQRHPNGQRRTPAGSTASSVGQASATSFGQPGHEDGTTSSEQTARRQRHQPPSAPAHAVPPGLTPPLAFPKATPTSARLPAASPMASPRGAPLASTGSRSSRSSRPTPQGFYRSVATPEQGGLPPLVVPRSMARAVKSYQTAVGPSGLYTPRSMFKLRLRGVV